MLAISQEQVLAHIGLCAVHGFRIQIPYLVKDLADMMYDLNGGPSPDDNTLPASINMDFNAAQDHNILTSTPSFCYWWEKPVVSEVQGDSSGPSTEDTPRVTREVTEGQGDSSGSSTEDSPRVTREVTEGQGDSSGSSTEDSTEGQGDLSGSDTPRVTREVTDAHFKAFWEGVSIALLYQFQLATMFNNRALPLCGEELRIGEGEMLI